MLSQRLDVGKSGWALRGVGVDKTSPWSGRKFRATPARFFCLSSGLNIIGSGSRFGLRGILNQADAERDEKLIRLGYSHKSRRNRPHNAGVRSLPVPSPASPAPISTALVQHA